MSLIENSNLKDYNYLKRINGLVRFKEKISLCGELEMKNSFFQENHTKTCQAIGDLRRICCEYKSSQTIED